ncbi:MAG TPA: hypothetical protein VLE73_03920 [Candidatus Saccharimonadales bacterium]|nr:hypothetical protein [Candidatus Saccharimonadales bacterium]
MTGTKEPPPHDTKKLSQLSTGLLVLNFKKEVEEPGYSAIGQKTYEHAVVGQRYSYCSDLIRVLNELKLTAVLLSEVSEQKHTDHKTHQPEELIAYYSGIFLDQVHQIKDKLLRMVDYAPIYLTDPNRLATL